MSLSSLIETSRCNEPVSDILHDDEPGVDAWSAIVKHEFVEVTIWRVYQF
jgi:hypothetical protein